MRTLYYPDDLPFDGTFAATIGFFDGVHQGHRFLIDQLKAEASQRGLKPMLITFERHPRQVVHSDWHAELLSTLDEKKALIQDIDVDTLLILRFDKAMASLSAYSFMEILSSRLGVRCLLTGYDNRFGHDRTEGFSDYCRYGSELGMEVVAAKPLFLDGSCISSSHVRHLLKEGKMEEACRCLGRPYSLSGVVVHGEQIGRNIGFPTANLHPSADSLIPRDGVYAVYVVVDGLGRRSGVTNIGTRPTFHGSLRTLETHIFDETGDFYGKRITLEFISRIRDEQPFPSVEALAEQISKDEKQAKTILENYEE